MCFFFRVTFNLSTIYLYFALITGIIRTIVMVVYAAKVHDKSRQILKTIVLNVPFRHCDAQVKNY